MYKDAIYSADPAAISYDSLILEHYGLNELNFETVTRYRQRFAGLKPDHPWNGLETKEFLYKIGAWGKLRNTNREGLTIAGLLMFSEERMITEIMPQYFLEYRSGLQDRETGTWEIRVTSQDGTWSGNVFDFYSICTEKLPAEPAVQELLLNTLVHAEYQQDGGILIEQEQDKLLFSNPGLPLGSLHTGLVSLRNPNLFKMFVLIGLCRRAGTGSQLLRALPLEQNSEEGRTSLVLPQLPVSAVPADETSTDPAAALEEVTDLEMPQFEESYNNESFINNEIEEFVVIENLYNNEIDSMNKGFNSFNKSENSMNNELNSINKSVVLADEAQSSCNKKVDSYNREAILLAAKEEIAAATEVNWLHLQQLAEPARRKRRMSPDKMEEIILQLLAVQPLRLKELAELLERTPDGLRNNYLSKLTDEGRLRLKYPNQVNHPKQAYMLAK